ncbi:hypothetical protein C0J52_07209 [Blattella germanica]|nr:hypothetical protein C0J52_07209 [Blattella germanica]
MPPVFVHAMPAINPGAGGSNGPQQQQRTSFRPPWVKDGPEPLPMPAAPWTLARARQRGPEPQEQGLPTPNLKPVPRKSSTTTSNNASENSSGPSGAAKSEPAPVRKTSKITIIPSRPAADAEGPKENGHDAGAKPKAQPVANEAKKPVPSQAKKQAEAKPAPKSEAKQIPLEIKSTSKPKQEEARQVNNRKQEEPPRKSNQKPVSAEKAEKLETLRSRPRKRPDWGKLMKEVETGHERLKHVQCNDRSSPLIPKTKVKGRKAEAVEAETEPDELDDIDKVRDDLQSTKQMLALELRNKEAVERENKKLLTRILNLEVELEKERAKQKIAEVVSPQAMREEDEQEKRKLRKELDEAQKTADEMESKFHDTLGQLDMARTDIEELQRKNQVLERKLQASILNQNGGEPLRKQPSSKKLASAKASAADVKQVMQDDKKAEEDEESEYEEVTETETESSEEEEEDQAVLQERRTARELKLLTTKLKSFKDKEEILKEEKNKYKHLQKEVDKVANMMKDEEEDEDEDEDEEEEESESESESESEESEDDESDGDLPPDAPAERRKVNLTERSKRHENCLAALRKGNYLLKANIDRLKDDLFKQKEMSVALQEDLNSVLAELG